MSRLLRAAAAALIVASVSGPAPPARGNGAADDETPRLGPWQPAPETLSDLLARGLTVVAFGEYAAGRQTILLQGDTELYMCRTRAVRNGPGWFTCWRLAEH